MRSYILNLTENYSNKVKSHFDDFGVNVTWNSKFYEKLISIETNKTKEELENFFLVESVKEDTEGKFITGS